MYTINVIGIPIAIIAGVFPSSYITQLIMEGVDLQLNEFDK